VNFEVLRLPDGGASDRLLFEFEPCAGADLGEPSPEGDRVNYFGLHLGPVKLLFIDPQLALHADQHLRLMIYRPVARRGSGDQDEGGAAVDGFLTRQMKRERNRHLRHQKVITLPIIAILRDAPFAVVRTLGASAPPFACFLFLLLALALRREQVSIFGDQAGVGRAVHHHQVIGAIGGDAVFGFDFVILAGKQGFGLEIPFIDGDRATHDFLGRQWRRGAKAQGRQDHGNQSTRQHADI
jgi:hypothetical protein